MSLRNLPASLMIRAIRLYQLTLSPLLGSSCLYQPSCSRYMISAIEKYGLTRGVIKGIRRLGRCHPWGTGGYDPP